MNSFIEQDGLPAFGRRARLTEDWFREYHAGQWIEEASANDSEGGGKASTEVENRSGATGMTDFPIAPYDRGGDTLEPGAIRLLSAGLDGGASQPVFVMILGRWGEGGHWVAPFSPYDAPGTEQELRTGLEMEPLRTLQLWSARSAPTALLSESWLADRAPRELVERARRAYRSMVLRREEPTGDVLENLGTAIRRENDPRRAWIRKQGLRLAPLTRLALFWEQFHAGQTAVEAAEETEEKSSPENIIAFPADTFRSLKEKLPAAAADSNHIGAVVIGTGLSRLFSRWLDADAPPGPAELEGGHSFPCTILTVPDPAAGVPGVFQPEGEPPPDGVPFLLVHKKTARPGGSGITAGGLLKFDRSADSFRVSEISEFMAILPRF